MSKRRREKHDINLPRTEPGSAKKMKITTRLRKHKAEPQPDSNAVFSPECRSKIQTGWHRLNNSLSESETEIVWDGNSPTAHLQRRIGRNGRSKAGDISEIVQCVNTQTGGMESSSTDMPLLGLWMTRSPNHPAVDLGVIRKTLAQSGQDSSKPKSTHRRTTGRLSLLQAELEKIANAINNSVSKDIPGDHIEKENLSSTDGSQKPVGDERQRQRQEAVCGEKPLPEQELVTGQDVETAPKNDRQASRGQTGMRQLVAEKSNNTRFSKSQPKTGHFGNGQLDCSQPTKSQPSTGQSVIGQSVASKSDASRSVTGQSLTGHSDTGQLVNGQFNGSHLVAGQSSSGHSSISRSITMTNASRLVTSKSTKYKSFTPSTNGESNNIKSNAAHLVSGQSSAGQSSTSGHWVTDGQSNVGQSSTSQSFTGHTVSTKSNACPLVTGNVSTVQSSTSQSTICQSNSDRLVTGQFNTGQSSTSQSSGHSVITKTNASHVVTCKSSFGLFSTSQSINGQSDRGKSNYGHSVTGHSSTGQKATPQPTIAKSVAGQSNSCRSVTVQSINGQLSTTQSNNGQSVSGWSNVAGKPKLLTNSNTSQLNSSHSTAGQSSIGRPFVFKSKTGQPVSDQSVVSHHSTDNQSDMSHAIKNHISHYQSDLSTSTNHQSALSKTITSKASTDGDNDSLWDDCEDFDDELLLEQLSQAEAMETCKVATKQQSPNKALQTNLPAQTNESNLQRESSNQTKATSIAKPITESVNLSSNCASKRANFSSLVGQQTSKESLRIEVSVTCTVPTNKFNFKKEAVNRSKPLTSVTRLVTDTVGSSSNCISMRANVGPPKDHQSLNESRQTNKPVASGVPTNKFNFKTEAGNQNKPLTSVTRPVTDTVGSSSNCVSMRANVGSVKDHQSLNESCQTNKPVASGVPTKKFNFKTEADNQNKPLNSVTSLDTDTVGSSSNCVSMRANVGPPKDPQSLNESRQTNKSVASGVPTNKFNFKTEAGNQSKPLTSVTRPVTDTVGSSSNCVSMRAYVGPPKDHQSLNESRQTNKPVGNSIQTNKFNFKTEAGNQNRPVTSVTKTITDTVGSSSNCVSVRANVGRPMDHQSPNESHQTNKPVGNSIQTNKFNFKREAGNQSIPETRVSKPVTITHCSSSNSVSMKANVGHPMDHQSPNESFQDNKPVTGSIQTNKFNFQRETGNQSKPVTGVTKAVTNTIGSSSNFVPKKANVGHRVDHHSPNEFLQTNKPIASGVQTNKFNFHRETSHHAKVPSVTNLITDTLGLSTSSTSKMMTVGPQIAQESELDSFDSSLTDDMLISMCAGLDSPHRQPSTKSDSKPVNSATSSSVNLHHKNSTRQHSTSGSGQSVLHLPATSSSVAHPGPPVTSTEAASSLKMCSQSEIAKKRQQAMARRKKQGNGSGAILK